MATLEFEPSSNERQSHGGCSQVVWRGWSGWVPRIPCQFSQVYSMSSTVLRALLSLICYLPRVIINSIIQIRKLSLREFKVVSGEAKISPQVVWPSTLLPPTLILWWPSLSPLFFSPIYDPYPITHPQPYSYPSYSIMVKNMDSEAKLCGFESQLHHLLAVWP